MAWYDWFNSKKLPSRPEVRLIPQEEISQVFIPQEEIVTNPILLNFTPDERKFLDGDWHYVSSTNVNALKYNLLDNTMDVEFQFDRYYKYHDVPAQFFIDFVMADSSGSFVWEEIRRPNRYKFTRFGGKGSRPSGERQIQAEDE